MARPGPQRPAGDWRDAAAYDRLLGIDRAGIMWEWLRRDQGYIAWHARASMVTRGTAAPTQWGLHFRRGPVSPCHGGAAYLACRS